MRASGGRKLEKEKFMSTEDLITAFNQTTDPLPQIPNGLKENVFFVIKNYVDSSEPGGSHSLFKDDCGTWSKGTSPKCQFLHQDSGRPTLVFDKTEQGMGFCIRKMAKGVPKFVTLKPKPDPDRIFTLRRYYTELKSCNAYRRRVTWLENSSISENYCVEYIGSYPSKEMTRYQEVEKNHLHHRGACGVASESSIQLSEVASTLVDYKPVTQTGGGAAAAVGPETQNTRHEVEVNLDNAGKMLSCLNKFE